MVRAFLLSSLLTIPLVATAANGDWNAPEAVRSGRGAGARESVDRPMGEALDAAERFFAHSAYPNVRSDGDVLYAENEKGSAAVAVYFGAASRGRETRLEVVFRHRPDLLYPDQDDSRVQYSLALALKIAILSVPSATDTAFASARDSREFPRGPRRPRDAAVVIGVRDYRDLPPVVTAALDAWTFRSIAQKTLGVSAANVLTLDEDVTAADIERALVRWLPGRVSGGSRVYVYFSGHAARRADGKIVLLGWDADPIDPTTVGRGGLPLAELFGRLRVLRGAELVVFLDGCYIGAERPADFCADGANCALFGAAGPLQPALSDLAEGHGVFSSRLFRGLGGAAKDRDGRITSGSLRDYLARTVPADTQKRQTPFFQGEANLSLLEPDIRIAKSRR